MDNKVKIVQFAPLSLYHDITDAEYASLTWSIRMGYPRLTVYTGNTKGQKDDFSYDKLIIAPFDAITVNMFIAKLKSMVSESKATKFSMKCYNIKYVNNEKTNEVALQATAMCGMDADGVIFLAAIAEDKRKIKFELLPNSKWHKLVNDSGDEITSKRELSRLYASAYCDRLQSLMNTYILDDTIIKYTDKKS